MFAADALRLVAVNGETQNGRDFEHTFQCLAVGLDEVLAVSEARVQ